MVICGFRFISSYRQKTPVSDEQSIVFRKFFEQTIEQIQTHPLWKDASFAELDAASEALEKYIMTKIYAS
jgi:hypothetical protein